MPNKDIKKLTISGHIMNDIANIVELSDSEDSIFNTETYEEMNTRVKEEDGVEHPPHYNVGIEVWDYTSSHNLDFLEGNIVKYVTRWKHKNGMEDLLKAKQYLDKLIKHNEIKNS